jgi:hypothetical protein
MGFKIFQILDQNSKGVSLRFYQKWQFAARTDRNIIFLDHDSHIPHRLHIIVMYISF